MPLPFITIKPHPNPLHLTIRERALLADFLRSLERSEERMMAKAIRGGRPYHMVRNEIRTAVRTAAMRQITGRQKGEGLLFRLERDVPVDDMEYVRTSLGVQREL